MNEKAPRPATPAPQPVPLHNRLSYPYALSTFCAVLACLLMLFWQDPFNLISSSHVGWLHKTVNWKPCFDNQDVLCATFGVPTNHDDPSEGTTYLSMTKVVASVPPHKKLGTVYTNPGGPGASGRTYCFTQGSVLRDLVGGKFDIVCWDPRGIGRTVPNVNCHGSAIAQKLLVGQSVLEKTFEVPPEIDSEAGRAVLLAQQKQALRDMELQAKLCEINVGAQTLKWMGTTTLVRDIEYLKNVIDGKDALINFHGGSYGTVVADYLVNMLPDKMGAVIAHGVGDPPRWAMEHYEDYVLLGELLRDAEVSYREWLDTVALHSELKDQVKSGKELGKKIDEVLDYLWETGGMPITGKDHRDILTSGMVRATLFETLQLPERWRETVQALLDAFQGDYLPLYKIKGSTFQTEKVKPAPDGFIDIGQHDLSRLAVSCADSPPYLSKSSWPAADVMLNDLLNNSGTVSSHFGLTVNLMEQHGGCQFWPRSDKPAPRFTGPWNHTLRTPMLVVSNTFDPITPAHEGLKMSDRFGDSARHLVQKRIGHSYLVEPTECYHRVAQKYFEEGRLPDEDVFCDADSHWFPDE